ncbi:Ig-like domain-containing protein [Aquimarina sp. SS2-1]|uniref:Ig-like domain-containing protein n=1 Tax=Aquimarina besae TaxID=3342247 RepID=UPI00366C2CBE
MGTIEKCFPIDFSGIHKGMKHHVYTLLALLCIIYNSYAQSSSNFSFSEDEIVIKNNKATKSNLTVFKGEISENNLSVSTPILGKTIQGEKEIRFIPLIPFGWNQKYTVLFNGDIEYFSLPIPAGYEPLTVTNIYPSDSLVPSNILKWYVKFSKPINKVNSYSHISILTEKGDTLSRAILTLENVLISENGTLLTVWMEPGRQKRGLIPNQQLGPVFKEKETYRFMVSKEIKDMNGVSMNIGYKHKFQVTSEDRTKPSIKDWKINVPNVNSVSKLIIHTDESLDYGSCIRNIIVFDSNQMEIEGSWNIDDKETVLSFTPLKPWKNDNYQIVFSEVIEDLAGNTLNRLFDQNMNNDLNPKFTPKRHKLDFNIK